MRNLVIVLLGLASLLFSLSPVPAQRAAGAVELTTVSERQEVEMVIYAAQDLTHIADRRLMELSKGINRVQFDWADTQIDPTSVRLRAVDGKGGLTVKNILFPADRPNALVWLIDSAAAGKRLLEVSYFTKGLSWEPCYQAIITPEGDRMSLKGFLRITNRSGEDYPNARISLVVGDLHLITDQILQEQAALGRPVGVLKAEMKEMEKALAEAPRPGAPPPSAGAKRKAAGMGGMAEPAEAVAVAGAGGVSEHFVYELGHRETIEDGWSRQLLSFHAWPVTFELVYKYSDGKHPTVYVKFKNDEEHKLGRAPLAEGPLSIFQRAEGGGLNAIANATMPHTAVGDEAEIPIQTDINVVVEKKMTDYKKFRFEFDPDKRPSGYEEERSFRIEITNTNDRDINLEVTQRFEGVWSIESPQKHEKKSANEVQWKLTVPAGQKSVIEYTVTTKFGTRIKAQGQPADAAQAKPEPEAKIPVRGGEDK